ncbi:uncharacterized protein GGS25DRAFT_531500 [Hypoxylon fragiforme]|uniref:uncharacterized protein n=1 Tax=Hypoxylon fragiforme TaxID=63214 RepID=UPI0020C5C412|nr:uncharacterized protein GGS25DRAFT_531500 [Hypoxylon fragiforme]KAI2608285.1 hypothetical protein GGS25DRAFT_531500 [Hypoxylon fragiforme]
MRAAGIYTRSKAKLLAVACLSLQGYWISEKREDYTEHDDIMPSLAVEKGAMAFLVSWKVCCHTIVARGTILGGFKMAGEEDFTLLGIAFVIIGLRMYVRFTQVRMANWQLDDYLMPLIGIIFGLATITTWVVVVKLQGLTNSHMSNELRQTLQHSTTEYTYREAGSKTQVFLWSVYVFILWALKVCVTAFYSRLTYVHKLPLFPTSVSSTTDEKRTASARLPELRLRVNFAYIMLGTTYVAVALTILLSCRPISKFWQINPNPGNTCQPAVSKAYAYVVIVPNVLTDLYLLSIPLPLLWKVNINWKRKAILLSLFSGAVFSMITGIVRAYIILHAGPNVVIAGSIWACRETFVAVIVANLPLLHPLFRRWAQKLGLSNSSSSSSRSLNDSRKHGSQPLTTFKPGRRRWNPLNRTPSHPATPLPAYGILVDEEIHITTEPAAPPAVLRAERAGGGLVGRAGGRECEWDVVNGPSAVLARTVMIGTVARMHLH